MWGILKMKNQPIANNQKIAPEAITTLLEQAQFPLISHISVPLATNTSKGQELNKMTSAFTEQLSIIKKDVTFNPSQQQQSLELTFGAPQIDLALPKDTLKKAALHEFNPVHWRDQKAALLCAIATMTRHYPHRQNQPIFCFFTEDQAELINWLSSSEMNQLNLNTNRLVIITAKHKDDLLWAIEETMHTANGAPIIAHFNLLENIQAQRLAFLATSNHSTCFIVCNHKTEGPCHCQSQWAVRQQSEKTARSSIYLKLTHTAEETDHSPATMATMAWTLNWQPTSNRFSATIEKGPTLH